TNDVKGNLTSINLPNGGTQRWTYDPIFSQPTSYTDANNNTTIYTPFTPDLNGNIAEVHGPDGSLTAYTYTTYNSSLHIPAGLVASETIQELGATIYNYGSHGLLSSIVEAAGTADEGTLTFHYNTSEDLDWSKDELNHQTDYVFDAL